MGDAVTSLWRAVRVLVAHPTLFVVIGGCSLIGVLFSFTLSQVPIVGLLIAPVGYPFIVAGVLSVAAAAIDGRPTYPPLVIGAKAYTVDVLLAFGLVSLLWMSVGFVLAMGVGISYAYDPTTLDIAMGVASITYIGVTGVFLVVAQFVDVGIVLGNHDVRASFHNAWNIAITEPVSVVGYSLVRWSLWSVPTIAWIVVILTYLPSLHANPVNTIFGISGWIAVIGLLSVPPVWTISYVYHVTFFLGLDERYEFISQ